MPQETEAVSPFEPRVVTRPPVVLIPDYSPES
jgi:hypothetical protein